MIEWLTKNVTGIPQTYAQAKTMNGSMCPTCIEGAVGSIPTYIPARFSVKTLCSKSRSLQDNQTGQYIVQQSHTSGCKGIIRSWSHIPDNIMDQTTLLQMLREILPRPFLDFLRKLSPLLLPILHALDIILRNPSLLLEACCRL